MPSDQRHLDRTCYGCHYFSIMVAESGYSDVTPGTDWSMECLLRVWIFDAQFCNENAFRTCLDTAQTCPHWKER